MAEVNTGGEGGGGKHAKKRAKKSSTRIDMTPMVDLAFLLLTFFVLTSTFAKPKTMEINFPAEPPPGFIPQKVNNAVTFILTKDNGVFYYNGEFYPEGNDKGEPPTKLIKTDFSPDGIHKLLLDRNKRTIEAINKLTERLKAKEINDSTFKALANAEKGRKQDLAKGIEAGLTVLVKADDQAVYKNVIDVIDECNICDVGLYAIVDLGAKELELLKATNK